MKAHMKSKIKSKIKKQNPVFNKTKIVATIGPASLSKKILKQLVKEGVDCARINTAHGDFEQYKLIINNVRAAGQIPIMIDIKGPEIRIRTPKEVSVKAKQKKQFGFKKGDLPYFNYDFSKDISKGDVIFFDNGLIKSTVLAVKRGVFPTVTLEFAQASIIKPNKGVNVPGKRLELPALSAKDKESIKFAIKQKASFIAVSFVRDKHDVLRVRKLLGNSGIGIISKIENQEGVNNIDEIIKVSDGIMVARGDLGVEVPVQKIPFLQKEMVDKCNVAGKIVVVATQMLESMTYSPIPTRAEVSDVANAVLDGADAVMLSGETALGKYPVLTVQTMCSIASEVEDKIKNELIDIAHANMSEEVSEIAARIAVSAKATKIVCITRSGYSANLVARFRPYLSILAVTNSEQALLKMKLIWGVFPILMKNIPKKSIVTDMAYALYDKKYLSRTDRVVFMGGVRTLQPAVSNAVEIHDIDDLLAYKKKFIK
ncbi:MAG: pyruvate kinase [Nanoarchaeota archaeon]|nr:pyruvate kinase [Nanoarchaeota archaeon]